MSLISSKSIQQAYIDLYVQLRKYIWDMEAIQTLVDLELNAFSAFPEIEGLKGQLYKLQTAAYNVLPYDEDMQKAFNDFFSVLEDGSSVCVKILQVKEADQDENN